MHCHFAILHAHYGAFDVQRLSVRKLDHTSHRVTSGNLLDVIVRVTKSAFADVHYSPRNAQIDEGRRASGRILKPIKLAVELERAHPISSLSLGSHRSPREPTRA